MHICALSPAVVQREEQQMRDMFDFKWCKSGVGGSDWEGYRLRSFSLSWKCEVVTSTF